MGGNMQTDKMSRLLKPPRSSASVFLLLTVVAIVANQVDASAIGWGAGAASQVRQTLLAAAAANTQWFPYTGTDCTTAAATASLQPGWPGAAVGGATTPAPGALSICLRRRILFRGGRWSPWRKVSGNVGSAWTPDWGSVGGVGNPGIDITSVVEDAILNAEDTVGLDALRRV